MTKEFWIFGRYGAGKTTPTTGLCRGLQARKIPALSMDLEQILDITFETPQSAKRQQFKDIVAQNGKRRTHTRLEVTQTSLSNHPS